MDLLLRFLPWALPPVIGAAIGYITNAIAIAMLFRPYTVKKVLGIKLPMTPGIIPKERYELSENIGNMVSRELLTEDAVRKQITSPSFKKSVLENIENLTGKLLNTPAGELKDTFKGDVFSSLKGGGVIRSIITDLLNSFLASGGLTGIIRGFLSRGIGYFGEKTPADLIKGREQVVDRVLELFLKPENGKVLKGKIKSLIERWIHDNRKVSEVLSPERAETLGKIALKLYGILFPEFIKFLNERSVRAELEIRGRFLLRDILYKLNRIQRFILSAAQYDKTLEDNIGSIIDDLIRNLEEAGTDPDIKIRIYDAVVSALKRFSALSLGEVAAAWKGDFWDDLDRALDSLSSMIFCDDFRNKLSLKIKDFILENRDIKIKVILYEKMGLSEGFIKEELPELIIPDVQFLKKLFSRENSNLLLAADRSLAEIFNIDSSLASSIAEPVTEVFLDLLSEKIPDILRSIDVQSLVVKKIDSLEIEKIEELILVVVKKQLRWINVFGAFLGSIIGAAQIVLNLSMR